MRACACVRAYMHVCMYGALGGLGHEAKEAPRVGLPVV